MSDEIVRVNLHCHSALSDGALMPEELARLLAADGVAYASLTDHDTCEGSRRFRQELARLGIGCIDGVEITAAAARTEVHLLAYGIDGETPALRDALAGERRRNDPGMQGLVDSMKRIRGRSRAPQPDALSAAEAIRLAHAAGGAVFLAHPLSYGFDRAGLSAVLDALAADGLDGIEALYGPYTDEQRRMLEGLARERGLAVCGGSDFHEAGMPGHSTVVSLSGAQWRTFRDLLLQAPRQGSSPAPAPSRQSHRGTGLGGFPVRIVLPTLLAIALFSVSIFAVIIPRFEGILLERKKELIRELTNSAVSILAEFAADEKAGRATRGQAQSDAAARIRDIRYGKEGKDYFWITDLHPTMIMHPYRADLVGADVSGYADANGVRVFVEFMNAVREKSEGYVEYLWQWKDDSHRIVPKLSFVKRFPAWDWVVGTGIYLDDVRAEIDRMARRLIILSIGIVVLLSLLLAFVAQQSLAIERGRSAAEAALRDSHENYRALVEASTEGMVMVVGGICTYANATFREMVGYSETELPLLRIEELVQPDEDGDGAGLLDAPPGEASGAGIPPCECMLRTRGGALIDALLTASRFALAGRDGWILAVRNLGARRRSEAGLAQGGGLARGGGPYAAFAETSAMGMFRATGGRRAYLLEANPAARRLFGIAADGDLTQVNLFSLLGDPAEAERLYGELAARGAVADREILLARPDGESLTISLSAALAKAVPGAARLEGIVVDVTKRLADERRREELLAETEASSLYLSEPVAKLARVTGTIGMNSPIRAAAARMSRDSCDALLVAGPAGEILGIVTDHDVRERLVAEGRDPASPVREIMSSPLLSIPESALLFEALLLMREKDIGHLAVRGLSGTITGILRGKDLLQLHRQSLAVMRKEIEEAASAEEVGECRRRLPELVRSLVAGGARPGSVARILASVSDMVVERLLALAVAEMGAPPAGFAFLALGSEGREEQTLGSDQDNAIVHEGRSEEPYFLALGEKVCSWLAGMGVPYCPGGIMAKNPAWCAPLATWEQYFAEWIQLPDAQELLDFNIFFDFRCVTGDRELAGRLRRSISALLPDNPPFFLHLAQDCLRRKLPPLFTAGMLRELLRAGPTEIDLKDAMSPVVRFARLYALRQGIEATNTLARLAALRDAGALTGQLHEQVSRVYTFLGELRLRCQEERLRATGTPSDILDTRGLAPGDMAMLRHAAAQVSLLQKRISFDFLGSAL